MGSFAAIAVLVLGLILNSALLTTAGKTSVYHRKLYDWSREMPLESDAFKVPSGYNAPQQVHITQGDHEGKAMIVSWVTPEEPGSNTITYWNDKCKTKRTTEAKMTNYKFYNYASGFIHHATLRNLEHDTKYFYEVGTGQTVRQFSFTTPPEVGPDVPFTFGIIGDLGQTFDSNVTVSHYENGPIKGQAMLMIGDLSYADDHPNHDNVRWDSWGRFIERSAAYQPWIWTPGNHELDFAPQLGENRPFKPFMQRFPTPFRASQSSSPLWYSVKMASAYIIVLSSYSAYGKYTPQYSWLEKELPKINRTETPWVIVCLHSPWYNTYGYHYMEGESMRVQFESWFVQYKVDLVLAGHVHAYERSERISNIAYNITNNLGTPVKNKDAPVYITIGDGGNIEDIANNPIEPQPDYSAFRESSYGHAIFSIKNRTHAYYAWNRNHDGAAVEADWMWFRNRYHDPVEETEACH